MSASKPDAVKCNRKRKIVSITEQPTKKRKLNLEIQVDKTISIKFHPLKDGKTSTVPSFTIQNPSTFAIGSDPNECAVVSSHPEVLSIHAEVTYDTKYQTLFIRALDYDSFVFVNEFQVTYDDINYALNHGDKIRVGLSNIAGFINEYRLEIITALQWSCDVCTLLNDNTCDTCAVCGYKPDAKQHKAVIPLQNSKNITQHNAQLNDTKENKIKKKQKEIKNKKQSETNTNNDIQLIKTNASTNTNAYIWSWYNNHHYVPYSDAISKSLNNLPIGHMFVFTTHTKTYEITKTTETKCEQRNVSTNYKRDVKRTTANYKIAVKQSASLIFVPHMNQAQVLALKEGNQVDHRDFLGQYHKAQIIEKRDTILKIHYIGWNESYDEWNDCAVDYQNFALFGSISDRRSYKYPHAKVRDNVYVHVHNQWLCGVIMKIDANSGQVQVMFSFNFVIGEKLHWFHLDNELEIRMDTSSSNNNMHKHIAWSALLPQFNINVHNKPLTAQSVEQKQVQSEDVQIVPFVSNMKYPEVRALQVNALVDVRDKYGQWFDATVVSNSVGVKLTIHYNGWDSSYDESIDYRYEWNRFAKHGSIASRESDKFEALEAGDFIDINPMQRHPGWRIAEIISKQYGQMQVEYRMAEMSGKTYTHWVHSDDVEECASFREKSGVERKADADSLFFESLRRSNYNITEVKDVSGNHSVYDAILKKKLSDAVLYKKRDEVEQYLWHGAKNVKNLEYILKNGFDRSFNATSKFGKGTYFAKHACYSVRNGFCGRDIEGVSYILLCKVIVGDYTVGTQNMSTIAKKPDGSEYDSLVNKMENPTVFVVWRDYHAVPYRLVKFMYG